MRSDRYGATGRRHRDPRGLQQRRHHGDARRQRRELRDPDAVRSRPRPRHVRELSAELGDGDLRLVRAVDQPVHRVAPERGAFRSHSAARQRRESRHRPTSILRRTACTRAAKPRDKEMAGARLRFACARVAESIGQRRRHCAGGGKHAGVPRPHGGWQLFYDGHREAHVRRGERARVHRHDGGGERLYSRADPGIRRVLRPDTISDRHDRVRRADRHRPERSRDHADVAGGERAGDDG